jgi:hypothetical protein
VINRQSGNQKSAMFRDPLNLMRLAPSKGETVIMTVPSSSKVERFLFLATPVWHDDYVASSYNSKE